MKTTILPGLLAALLFWPPASINAQTELEKNASPASHVNASSNVVATAEKMVSKSFAVHPGGKFVLQADRGSIELVTWDRNTAGIEIERKVTGASSTESDDLLKGHLVTFIQDGDQIIVRAKTTKALKGGWFRSQPNLNVRWRISLPRKFEANLKTGGGGVTASGLDGRLEVKSGGGSLNLSQITGPVVVQTGGGSISASACTDKMSLDTGGGSIHIAGFAGPSVQAQTGGGSISADLANPPKSDCEFHTGGGSVTVTVPESSAINLDASTGGGSVSSALAVAGQNGRSRTSLSGAINGGGPAFQIRTGGGSIELLKR